MYKRKKKKNENKFRFTIIYQSDLYSNRLSNNYVVIVISRCEYFYSKFDGLIFDPFISLLSNISHHFFNLNLSCSN